MNRTPSARRRRLALVAAPALVALSALLAPPMQASAQPGSAPATTADMDVTAVDTAGKPEIPVGTTADGRTLRAAAKSHRMPATTESAPYTGSGDIADAGPNVRFDALEETEPVSQVTPFSIIGTDDRTQVTATTAYPNRTIVYLSSSNGWCTGFLVSADTVVTAGHCLYYGGRENAWFNNFRVYPGKNGQTNPYGSCGYTEAWTSQQWIDDAVRGQDWGILKLNCTVGVTTGWLGMRWQAGTWMPQDVTVRGYTTGKPAGTMWTDTGPIKRDSETMIIYDVDTNNGQSGSPVYIGSGAGSYAIGIHTVGTSVTGDWNGGTRISKSLYDTIGSHGQLATNRNER